MTLTAIKPYHYNLIVERIREGRCVPFLGAGVNASSDNYEGLPLASKVGLRLAKALTNLGEKELDDLTKSAAKDIKLRVAEVVGNLSKEELALLTEDAIDERLDEYEPLPSLISAALPDLSRLALHVEVENDFDYLMKLVREVLPDKEREPSPLLKTLASLPFELIVTTNYDRLLERAFGDKPYEKVVQPINGFSEDEQKSLGERLADSKDPIIYKIHGSFSDNGLLTDSQSSNRLILTEEDYIQFLSIVGQQGAGVPLKINEKMKHATILFLGYSLQDWDFRTIYKTLIEPLPKSQRPKSFAIQKDPPDFWVRYWDSENKKVTILDVDLYQFASELEEAWHIAGAS